MLFINYLSFSVLCNQAVQMKVFIDELSKTGKLEGVCYTYWEETFTSKVQLAFLLLSKS